MNRDVIEEIRRINQTFDRSAIEKMMEQRSALLRQIQEVASRYKALYDDPLKNLMLEQEKHMQPFREMERLAKQAAEPLEKIRSQIQESVKRMVSESVTAPPILEIPLQRLQLQEMPAPDTFADTFYQQFKQAIEVTLKDLKKGQDLTVFCTTAGGATIIVHEIGYSNPFMIVLHGQDSAGNERKIVTHMQNVHLELKITSAVPGKPKRRIGFLSD